MKLLLERKYKKEEYTIGNLYIDGKFFCNTLEDKDRGLSSSMTVNEIKEIKVYGKTAIPTGTYEITLNVVSPKFSTKTFYKEICDGKVPRLLNVKGFDGILIHVGEGANGALLTYGCILVGSNTIKGGLTSSKETFKNLYKELISAKNKGESITIEIQ